MTSRQQCQCLTKQGKGPQCSRLVEPGSNLCYQHRGSSTIVKPNIPTPEATNVIGTTKVTKVISPIIIRTKTISVSAPVVAPESHDLLDLRRFNVPNIGKTLVVADPIKRDKTYIINLLKQLIQQTENVMKGAIGSDRQKHQFRLTQFKKAVGTLADHPGEITSGTQAKMLKGIGKGIADRIDEIIRTGTLVELSQKEREMDPQTVLIHELTSVTGIGEANAKKFIEQGVTSLDDLRDKASRGIIKLTHHMQIGLKYYHEIEQRIPFQEVEDIGQMVRRVAQTVHPEVLVEICGSHRRLKPFSGDLDILMTSPTIMTEDDLIVSRIHYLKEIVKALKDQGVIIDDLTSQGDTKYMGVCEGISSLHDPPPQEPTESSVSDEKRKIPSHPHRIDIRFVPMESYYPAMLYFTGSQQFNVRMRQVALEKGYTLNEYGLYRLSQKNQKIMVHSEKEIFEILEIIYLEPHERDFV